MRPSSGMLALPADLRQQLLAMPLSPDEKSDVASALLALIPTTTFSTICRTANKNAPQPDRLRGV